MTMAEGMTPKEALEAILDPAHAAEVVNHRQRIRKPLTAYAAQLLAAQFAKCPDPNAAADQMITAGWQGFKPEWVQPKPPASHGARRYTPPPQPDSVSPEERKRVGGRMLALGQALSAATKEARTKMDAERRRRVRERQDMILARDHRSTAERLGFTAGDGGMGDD